MSGRQTWFDSDLCLQTRSARRRHDQTARPRKPVVSPVNASSDANRARESFALPCSSYFHVHDPAEPVPES
ncbi:hypothetical protein VTJ04DRAFT_1330 [Mycothermus thermophilus]|uniref:uncharacterized protein n=1 Tax=Humicola insolens TaxID=85995 RepID=UPI003742A97F